MKISILLCIFAFFASLREQVHAQTAASITKELDSIDHVVASQPCEGNSAQAISHRAMNVFLADKTGYLSGSRDLSYFTNHVSLNSLEGKIAVSHNFQPRRGKDDPLKKLFNVGFEVTVPSNYTTWLTDQRYEGQIAITINYKWMGRVKTKFSDCQSTGLNQKTTMDILRSTLLAVISSELKEKEDLFLSTINNSDTSAIAVEGRQLVKNNFYKSLYDWATERYASGQAELLTSGSNFKLISTGWTSIYLIVPAYFPSYHVSPSFTEAFYNRHPYPLNIHLSHTRLWESSKTGRIFLTLDGSLTMNNSKLGYGLNKYSYAEYKSLGGTNTEFADKPSSSRLYIGPYSTFATGTISAELVYFPRQSHIGFSLGGYQSLGDYHPFSCKVGLPVVLINKQKTPAVQIECYVLFLDLGRTTSVTDRNSVGISVGIPFSRLMY